MQPENRQDWIIYGAYGYAGKLVLEEALAQGRRPIIAGRTEAKLKPIAESHGLQYRAFNVEDAAQNIVSEKELSMLLDHIRAMQI